MTEKTTYQLLVDTDSYSGNFERESIAFATGLVGECEVGSAQAEMAEEGLSPEHFAWWEENVVNRQDEHGTWRPAFIAPTPGFFNNGYGGHFPDTEEGEKLALAAYKKAAETLLEQNLKRLDSVVIGQNGWTEEARTRERKSHEEKLEAAQKQTKVRKHDCYQSVGIEVKKLPPSDLLDIFFVRMREFLDKKGVRVIGHAVEEKTVEVKVKRQMR